MIASRTAVPRPRPPVVFLSALLLQLLLILLPRMAAAQERMIIAADGGSGGPLANTLPAVALAATLDIDLIELPLAVTKDDELVVFHDLILDPVTDVTEIFPDRARENGNYYLVDFSLAEIRQLRRTATSASRLPAPALGIPTLSEVLSLLRTLENDLHKQVGIAPNIQRPEFHRREGKDISSLTLQTLHLYGYTSAEQPVLLQSLDGDELQRLKKELLPAMDMQLSLLQLIDRPAQAGERDMTFPAPYDHTWMFTRLGMRVVSSYAAGVALHTSYFSDQQNSAQPANFLADARALGLKIYVFTLEDNPRQFPAFATTYLSLLEHFYRVQALDGVITASPRATVQYIAQQQMEEQKHHNIDGNPLSSDLPNVIFGQQPSSRIILHTGSTP